MLGIHDKNTSDGFPKELIVSSASVPHIVRLLSSLMKAQVHTKPKWICEQQNHKSKRHSKMELEAQQ